MSCTTPLPLNIDQLSATEIAHAVRAKELSATEVAKASLAAIEAHDGKVQAFLELSAELALEAAHETDRRIAAGEDPGLLAGVPLALKDNLQLLGTHTTCASLMLKDYQSVYTASCVAQLLAEGATPVGKTNMDEFAFGSSSESSAYHPSYNPWDLQRVPGGSSGGSAAAVAAGEVPLALGSDTGGSIRQPASFCGVVGFKPSYGSVSRYGVVAFGSSLEQVGPLARTVADVALTMDALVHAGRDPFDATSCTVKSSFCAALDQPLEGLCIGIVPELMELEGLSAECRQAVLLAQKQLEDQGAHIVPVDLPHISAAIAAYYVIGPCEAFSNLARFDGVRYGYQEADQKLFARQTALSRAHGFGKEARRRQLLGAYLLTSGVYDQYYYPAQQLRTLISQDYERAFERCDALLLPTVPRTAFRLGELEKPIEMYAADLFTVSSNIVGNGSISVPMGLGADSDMPVSVQFQGPVFADQRLMNLAQAIERSTNWAGTVAPQFAGKGGEL